MQTDLNKKVDTFFSKHSLEDITVRSITKDFPNLKECNDYGNLLHAMVNDQYDEEKILKAIEILMSLGIDVNYQAKETGYSFIHLALYGYTGESDDYSYSTEFIIKLIELAKKYHFDVNLKDKDMDSIVHTSLASEVYTGKTIPILKSLGTEFNIENQDNQKHNIYDALLYYEKEAKSSKNQEWFDRLEREKEDIQFLVQKITLEEVESKLASVLEQVQSILKKMQFYELEQTKSKVEDLNTTYQLLLNQRAHFTQTHYQVENLMDLYQEQVKELVRHSVHSLKEKPNRKELQMVFQLASEVGFSSELKMIAEIQKGYEQQIQNVLIQFNQCECVSQLEKVKGLLDAFSDQEVRTELEEKYTEKKNGYDEQIRKIHELESSIEFLQNWIIESSVPEYVPIQKEEMVFENCKMTELLTYYQKELSAYENIRSFVQSIIVKWAKQLGLLIDQNLFSQDDVMAMFSSKKETVEDKKVVPLKKNRKKNRS